MALRLSNFSMTKFFIKPYSFLAILVLLVATACSAEATAIPTDTEAPLATSDPEKATRSEVLQSLTSQVILPGYTSAVDSMSVLKDSIDALCSSPSKAELDTARDAWREARQAWLRTESYRFGPAMDRRSLSLVDWWPIDGEKIDRNLEGAEKVTPEQVSEFFSATQRGLGTAEYLLFGAGSAGIITGTDTQHCAYIQSVAVVASDEVAGILGDWQGTADTDGYAGYFDGTGSISLLDSEAEAEVVRSLVFQVRAIANMRLGAALGVDAEADASTIPDGDADNTREDLLSQLESVASMYRGANGGLGLSARVAAVSEETDARMLAAIDSTIRATKSLDGSLINQLKTDPGRFRVVYDNLKELQRVLNTEIVSLLGVSVGFSDTDGDS